MGIRYQYPDLDRRHLILAGGCTVLAGCTTFNETYRSFFGPVSLEFDNSEQFLEDASKLKNRFGVTKITQHAVRFYTYMKWREVTGLDELRSVNPGRYLKVIDKLHELNVVLIEQDQDLDIEPDTKCSDSALSLRRSDPHNRTMFVPRKLIVNVRRQLIDAGDGLDRSLLLHVFDHLMRPAECRNSELVTQEYIGYWVSDESNVSGEIRMKITMLENSLIKANASFTGNASYNQAFLQGTYAQLGEGKWIAELSNPRLVVDTEFSEIQMTGNYEFSVGLVFGLFDLVTDRGHWNLNAVQ